MKILNFEDFVNEANLSEEFLKFSPGDVVIMTKSVKLSDFDFKKSATTWWGQKVMNSLNMATRNDSREIKRNDILWIFTSPSKIDSKGKARITGYAGGFLNDKHHTTNFKVTYDYEMISVQLIILSLMEGYAKVVKYNELPDNIRREKEEEIRLSRVREEIRNGGVILDDMEIISYDWEGLKNDRYIFKGYHKDTGEKLPDILMKGHDIRNKTFINVNTGEEITGDPFIK